MVLRKAFSHFFFVIAKYDKYDFAIVNGLDRFSFL